MARPQGETLTLVKGKTMRGFFSRLALTTAGALFLLAAPAVAEVRLTRPAPGRIEVVSDGVSPWRIPFSTYDRLTTPTLVSLSADRVFFVHGSVLHLIDSKNGVVIRRWIFPDGIDTVRAEGSVFRVQTSRTDSEQPLTRTTTIGLDLPAPAYWMDNLLLYRIASFEGSIFDRESHLERYVGDNARTRRAPLARQDAERLLVDVKEAVRRNPFQVRLAVVEALLLKDIGRQEQADAVFRSAMVRTTNQYGELFWIAHYLEEAEESEWAGIASDRAVQTFLEQGSDPRLVSLVLPKLLMGYLPYDLRVETTADRRSEMSERLYRMAPYVQGSSAAWSALAEFFEESGNLQQASLWRTRAAESAKQSGYVWEFGNYAARTMRLAVAFLLAAILFCVVLQRRYAPRSSVAFWDRRDRLALVFLLLTFWLSLGAFGAMGETAALIDSMPVSVGAGSLRAPVTRAFLENLGKTPERNFLLALSLQQQGELEGAESLYRSLPKSAEAWNNLGVLQAAQGRVHESATSFKSALKIDSEMNEAALNLGQPTKGYWAVVHRQYLPAQKMLAMPSHEMVYRAIRGPLSHLVSRILMGPFSAARALKAIEFSYYESFEVNSPLPLRLAIQLRNVWTWGLSLILGAVLLALHRVPYREVTQPPSQWHWLLQLAAAGTSRRWKVCGGLVLGLFVYGILENVFHYDGYRTWFNWSYISGKALGLSPALTPAFENAWPPHTSTGLWSQSPVILVALILAVNAVIVLRASRAGTKA